MKISRIVFIRWTALFLLIAVTICSLVLRLRTKNHAQAEVNVPAQPRYAATLDRRRAIELARELLRARLAEAASSRLIIN